MSFTKHSGDPFSPYSVPTFLLLSYIFFAASQACQKGACILSRKIQRQPSYTQIMWNKYYKRDGEKWHLGLAPAGKRNLGSLLGMKQTPAGKRGSGQGLTLSSETEEKGKVCVLFCNLNFYGYLLVGCFAWFWSISTSIYAQQLVS